MKNSASLNKLASSVEPKSTSGAHTSSNNAKLIIDAEDIHTLDARELHAVKSILQHGKSPTLWETPLEWLPLGHKTTHSIDIKCRIIFYIPPNLASLFYPIRDNGNTVRLFNERGFPYSQMNRLIDQAVIVAMRYLILLRMGPSRSGRRSPGKPLAITTINAIAHQTLPYMLAICLSKIATKTQVADFYTGFPSENFKFFSFIELDDLALISRQRRINVNLEIERMHMLGERECWNDRPAIQPAPTGKIKVKGPAPQFIKEHKRKGHLPLPDEYVSDMGRRSIWLMESLGPTLLSLVEKFPDIWTVSENLGWSPGNVEIRRRELVESAIADHMWIDSAGHEISVAPFKIELSKNGRKSGQDKPPEWPPRRFTEVMHLLLTVQMAHLFIVSMSLAGRTSEILSLKRDCLQSTLGDGPTAIGKTYKFVQKYGGGERDWALPEIAGKAIEQQLRLIKISENIPKLRPAEIRLRGNLTSKRDSTEHLWGQVMTQGQSDPRQPLEGLCGALQRYASTLGLPRNPGGQPIRPHRIRKTVARLVALAIMQAPKVLMDVFGHKSIEMTLYYILSDKDLRTEIEQISRELRIMRAKEAIEEIVRLEDEASTSSNLAGYGGLASLSISRAIKIDQQRHHQRGESWGADSIQSLAETLTLQGKAWQIVRPGIICTKFPGTEAGPCNLKKGAPEPSRCQASCSHRLEESFLRQDVDASIQTAIRAFEEADKNGDELLTYHWAEQVRANIGRFADLKEKWMKIEIVKKIL